MLSVMANENKQANYSNSSIVEKEKEKYFNEMDFAEQSVLNDGSIQRIYRDGSIYIMKSDEDKFKRVENMSNKELENMKRSERNICKLFFEITKDWQK